MKSVAVSADGKYIVSTSLDQTLKIWSLEDREKVASWAGDDKNVICLAAFTADSLSVLFMSGQDVCLFSIFSSDFLFEYQTNSPFPSIPASQIFRSNAHKWISGEDLSNCASYWNLRPEFINSIHISAHFNNAIRLDSALQHGVPIFKSIFGSPVAISLQRNAISCLDVLLKHITAQICKDQSDSSLFWL